MQMVLSPEGRILWLTPEGRILVYQMELIYIFLMQMVLSPGGRIFRLAPEGRILVYQMELLPSTVRLSQVTDII